MLEYGFSITRIFPFRDKIYDSVLIGENKGQKNPEYSGIFCAVICRKPSNKCRSCKIIIKKQPLAKKDNNKKKKRKEKIKNRQIKLQPY